MSGLLLPIVVGFALGRILATAGDVGWSFSLRPLFLPLVLTLLAFAVLPASWLMAPAQWWLGLLLP